MSGWRFEQLPVNLPAGPRYVGWNVEQRAGQTTKVPYQPTGRRASVSDPSTWATLEDAQRAVEDGSCDGLGLVLAGDMSAIDLDRCIDPLTRCLSENAIAILRAVPTYTEVSPSDLGLRLLLAGSLPSGRRRRTGFECYDSGRFVTLTGWHVDGTCRRIVDQTSALQTLHARLFPASARPAAALPSAALTLDDETLVDKAHRARNGALFAQLWAGDTSAYPSASEADAALCRQLAFWTQRDVERIDRLFRQSGLYRAKWDANRGSDSYGSRTIQHAIATTPAVYTPPAELEVILPCTAEVSVRSSLSPVLLNRTGSVRTSTGTEQGVTV